MKNNLYYELRHVDFIPAKNIKPKYLPYFTTENLELAHQFTPVKYELFDQLISFSDTFKTVYNKDEFFGRIFRD